MHVIINDVGNGVYRCISYYNHNTGLARIGGRIDLISLIDKDLNVIDYYDDGNYKNPCYYIEDGEPSSDNKIGKLEQRHLNAHKKTLKEKLNPSEKSVEEVVEIIYKSEYYSTPIIKKAIILDKKSGRVKIKTDYGDDFYEKRNATFVLATDYKKKCLEKYEQLKAELDKVEKELFAEEVAKCVI